MIELKLQDFLEQKKITVAELKRAIAEIEDKSESNLIYRYVNGTATPSLEKLGVIFQALSNIADGGISLQDVLKLNLSPTVRLESVVSTRPDKQYKSYDDARRELDYELQEAGEDSQRKATLLYLKALSYSHQGEYKKGKLCLVEALAAAKDSGEERNLVKVAIESALAEELRMSGQYEKSEEKLNNVIKEVRTWISELESSVDQKDKEFVERLRVADGRLLRSLGMSYRYRGDVQRARDYLERAIIRAKKHKKDTDGDVEARIELAYVLTDIGDIDSAEEQCDKALKGATDAKNYRHRAYARAALSNVLREKAKAVKHSEEGTDTDKRSQELFEKAISFAEQSRKDFEGLRDRRGLAYALLRKGKSWLDKDPMDAEGRGKARVIFEEALELLERIGDLRGQGYTRIGLGETYNYLGADAESNREAEKHFLHAVDVFKMKSDNREFWENRSYEQACFKLARIYRNFGKSDKAKGYYESVIERYKPKPKDEGEDADDNLRITSDNLRITSDNLEIVGHAYRGLANVLSNLGGLSNLEESKTSFDEIQENYRQSASIFRQIGYHQGKAAAYNGLGVCARKENNLAEAESYFESALYIYKKFKSLRGEAYTLYYQGELRRDFANSKQVAGYHASIRDHELAVERFRDVGDRRGLAYVYASLSETHYLLKELQNAEDRARKALEIFEIIGDERGRAYALLQLGRALSEQNEPTAHALLDEAIKIFEKVKDSSGEKKGRRLKSDLSKRGVTV
ncbi:MAG: tetratricopeptide repeat protein [Trueperaceae bacterium]|nr:tetratricopeptide repeat protein [Trueperaceae bacterium]